ncbi:hypothetical protein RND71_005183 [Anisodus tanguticus]|uniref:RING-type domain-containing protein n=1 Tax=Anisodus tanguticus TaxID=243964 RepID=A0AAE1SRM9_9SOLA|nr:hypothetical protein RND71_005183 [Anisodus tanguticus]
MPIPIQNQESNQNVPKTNQNHPNLNNKPRKLITLFLKCIVMAIFLSLFFLFLLFLGFAALVLLHFLVTSTAFRRRYRRRQRFPARTHLPELPCESYCGSQEGVRDCAICLEEFKEGEFCRKLPDCGHLFHVKCVDSWLIRVLNCPVCRTRVRVGSGNTGSGQGSDEDWKRWWAVGVSG